MYDIVMITYGEVGADDRFKELQGRFPWRVLRVDGVDGIWNAHYEAARTARTKWFYVVDGDCRPYDVFEFDFQPYEIDEDWVYVWKCYNPVTDLSYGHSGIKLFNKRHILRYVGVEEPDFTTTIAGKFTLVNQVASVTEYYMSGDFAIWRTAFREYVKLQVSYMTDNSINHTDTGYRKDRLELSATSSMDPNNMTKQGAKDASDYLYNNILVSDDGTVFWPNDFLITINDYNFLKEKFENERSNK